MFVVTIQKRFVSGFLHGLTSSDSVSFPNEQSAKTYTQWAETHKTEPVTPCVGLSQYVIDSFTIERDSHAA